MNLGKIAVIGDADSVLGFRGLGIMVYITDDPMAALKKLDELRRAGCHLIFITEYLAAQNPGILEKYKSAFETAVILIPSAKGGENFAQEQLRETVKSAIGMDLLNLGGTEN